MTLRLIAFACLMLIVVACGAEDSPAAGQSTATSRSTASTATPSPSPTEPISAPAPTETSTPTAPDDQLATLDGTDWIVTAIGDEPAAEGFVARLRFVNGNEIGGEIACDGLGLEYEIDGSAITPTIDLQRTTFDCTAEEDPEDQGDEVYAALEQMASFTATESNLDLFDENGTLLLALDRFLPPPLDPALEGDWAVISLNGEEPIGDGRLSLTISYESVGGFSGCNSFGGPRSPLASNALDVEWIGTNDADCPDPPKLHDQEETYQSVVGHAASYLVEGDTLKLLDASGNVLVEMGRIPDVVMDPPDLVGVTWLLTGIDGEAPPTDSGISLIFETDERFIGFGGCRWYEGEYQAEGDDIHVGTIGMASTTCDLSEEYLRLEQEFVEAVGDARRYAIEGDTLKITTVRGQVLEFTPLGR